MCLKESAHIFLPDNARRAFLRTFSAFCTLLIIDMSHVVFNGDSAGFALFLTQLAGKTAGLADLLDCGTAVMAGAADCVNRRFRNKLNQMPRTGCHTFSAGLAFGTVHTCNAMIDADCTERAGRSAGTKADTAIITGPRGESAADSGSAIMNADVMASGRCIFTVTGAFDVSGDFLCLFHLKTEHPADLFCDGISADRTGVYRCLLIGDSRCKCIASGITAAAAVVAGQAFANRNLFFIYFYFEFFIDCDQQDADQHADDSHSKRGNNDR